MLPITEEVQRIIEEGQHGVELERKFPSGGNARPMSMVFQRGYKCGLARAWGLWDGAFFCIPITSYHRLCEIYRAQTGKWYVPHVEPFSG